MVGIDAQLRDDRQLAADYARPKLLSTEPRLAGDGVAWRTMSEGDAAKRSVFVTSIF